MIEIGLIALSLLLIAVVIFLQFQNRKPTSNPQLDQLLVRLDERDKHFVELRDNLLQMLKEQQTEQQKQREKFDEHQINSLKMLTENLRKGIFDIRKHVNETLNTNTEILGKQVQSLTDRTTKHLQDISGQVEKRLSEGFEKTTATFTDVVKRLALIDQAQQKITELSSNVVSLQEVLVDKRARGAFGEVQLNALIRNMLPEQAFSLQHTLSNGRRADAILFLPEPTGNVVIDAKFPLESYRTVSDPNLPTSEKRKAEQQFRHDIRKHIKDIAERYVIADETADGAMMFIPAEAIFAEIHAHFPELVDEAHKVRVWIVSPTTIMAILTTARAVLKDAATRQQVHIIQEHLGALSKDFDRFEKRMENLARHIAQTHSDVDDIHKSSRKITSRFGKIERVELQEEKLALTEED